MDTLTLADGRKLAYLTYGNPDGVPVVFSHGLGDSRVIRNPDDELTASIGVHMVAADQPGVGGSSPQRGRRLADWANDMEQLADHLGLEHFAVAGHSGGGPHTLAIAAHLGDRVSRGVLASPVGPASMPDFLDLIASKELRMAAKMRKFHHLLHGVFDIEAWIGQKDVAKYMQTLVKSDPSDKQTFFANEAQQQMFEENFRLGIAQGGEGMNDLLEAVWEWDFDFADVPQRFDVFFGDADDLLDPKMGETIAESLPDGHPYPWPGAGHYGFVDRGRWVEFLTPLAP